MASPWPHPAGCSRLSGAALAEVSASLVALDALRAGCPLARPARDQALPRPGWQNWWFIGGPTGGLCDSFPASWHSPTVPYSL